MKKSLFVLVAAAAVLAGCQQENFSAFKADKADYAKGIKAVIAADETRTSVVADGDVYHVNWVSGDQIILQKDGGFNDFYVTEDSGMNTASFYRKSGDAITFDGFTLIQAYYPASYYVRNSGEVALPATQGYSANGIINNPMYAEAIPDSLTVPTFEFKNLCGVLKINATSTVAGAAVKSISLKADQGMSGLLNVIGGAAVVDGTDGVTLKCDEAVALSSTPTAFYFAIPANNYTNLEITVTTADAKKQTFKMKADKTLSIERSKIYEADFAFNKFEGSDVTLGGVCTLGPGSEISAAMKSAADPISVYLPEASEEVGQIYNVNKIVFSPRDPSSDGVVISDPASACRAYASYNSGTGVLTISSTADTFCLGEDGTYLFSGFTDVTEIVGLDKLNTEKCTDMKYMFAYMRSVEKLDLSNFKTDNVTSMTHMFYNCQNAKEINVSSFNTGLVDNMGDMFYRCASLESLDCSNFNTENVTNMEYMFCHLDIAKSINVKGFNTSNVTNFRYFLNACYELVDIDVSGFDTSGALNLIYFFNSCYSIKNLDINFDTSSVTSLIYMFWGMRDLETLRLGENFDISNVTKLDYMFDHCMNLKEMWLSEFFLPSNGIKPTNFFCYKTATENWKGALSRPGVVNGSLTIHCTQETADWLATTDLRWLPTGYNTAVPCPAIPVKFLNLIGGGELFVSWAPN